MRYRSHLKLSGRNKKDGLTDYLKVAPNASEVNISPDGDRYDFNYDMDSKSLGFIQTNFDRSDYTKMKQAVLIDSAHLLTLLSNGIP